MSQRLLQWIERGFRTVGITLLAVWCTARIESVVVSRSTLEQLEAFDSDQSRSIGRAADETRSSLSEINFRLWDKGRVRAYERGLTKVSGIPLAVLRIPAIGLEVPVLEGTDNLTLNHAVGRIAGTAQLGEAGNIGIAGHRDGFFRGLKNVSVGDTVELRGPTGTVAYKVDRIGVVAPRDVSVLKSKTGPSVTLVTCYPFYFVGNAPQRYIVSSSLVQAPEQAVRLASIKSRQFTRRNNE